METSRVRKPDWLKVALPKGESYFEIKNMLQDLQLATVCEEAKCPNISECWGGGTATFMLMGEVCTRGCRFCAVKTGNPRGKIDSAEPEKVGQAIAKMKLNYVVITSVARDDLPDEGASHFARTIRVIKQNNPRLLIEVLTPDFKGRREFYGQIVEAGPDVFAQNIETVERLTHPVRDRRTGYWQTLNVLKGAKELRAEVFTKSSLMLGLGETAEEVMATLRDLRSVGCDVVTFGQYLQPTARHLKVARFVEPEEFDRWKRMAESMGFLYVASGPLVRSSYRAGEFFMEGMIRKRLSEQGAHQASVDNTEKAAHPIEI